MENSENNFLWKLLANPADQSYSYVYNLQLLVNDYPQSGVLRALLVPKGDEEHLKHAAAYFTPGTMYKMVNNPDSLLLVNDSQIVYTGEPSREPRMYIEPPVEPFVPPEIDESANYFHVEDAAPQDGSDIAYVEDEEQDVSLYEEIAEAPVISNEPVAADDDDEPVRAPWEQEDEEEIATTEPIEESLLAKEYEEHLAKQQEADANVPVYTFDSKDESKVEYFHQDIDDAIYDEIVSIEDIGLAQLAIMSKEPAVKEVETIADTNLANHFVFEEAAAETTNEQPVQTIRHAEPTQKLSRYNDEKMPYTFMWWLDKTRKEHADKYQPYVSNSIKPAVTQQTAPHNIQTAPADELQQQYYENIFNINSINGIDSGASQPAVPHAGRKEDKIIERFIQEEPQIKHPSMIKLNNENKAKKSSEDRDELVTETLARIYTEQMLYHKAILTYKKLMLKFPEKSLYFAGQIEQLENKIN